MNKHSVEMRDVRACVYLCVLALAACSTGPGKEITSTKPYADHIGAKYSIVVDDLYAYGVYKSMDERTTIGYVTLVPQGNIAGSQFAFRRRVPKGLIIKILSAWQPYVLLERSVYYLVAVENSDLPQGIPIELQLDRGNEGVGGDLNPAVYRKLPRDN